MRPWAPTRLPRLGRRDTHFSLRGRGYDGLKRNVQQPLHCGVWFTAGGASSLKELRLAVTGPMQACLAAGAVAYFTLARTLSQLLSYKT